MRITESQLRNLIREMFDDDEEDWNTLPFEKRYPEPKTEVIGPNYRLPNGEPVTDEPVYGGYTLYPSPEAAYNTIVLGGHTGSHKNILVYRDPKTGKYWGRLEPDYSRGQY